MSSDNNEPQESSSSPRPIVTDRLEGAARSLSGEHTQEHHYEPEAHHAWFPSEKFFLAWLAVGCCGFLGLAFALIAHHVFSTGFRPGDLAEHDIRAKHATAVVDEMATRAAKDHARSEVVPVFKPAAISGSPHAVLKQRLDEIEKIQSLGLAKIPGLAPAKQSELMLASDKDLEQLLFSVGQSSPSGKVPAVSGQSKDSAKIANAFRHQHTHLKPFLDEHPEIKGNEILIALMVPPEKMEDYSRIMVTASKKLHRVFSAVPLEDRSLLTDVTIEFVPDSWPMPLRQASAELVTATVQPKAIIDKEATAAKADQAAARVQNVIRQIKVGDLIVRRNGEITPETINTLQAMGITNMNHWPVIGGLIVSLAAAVSLVALFLYTFDAKLLFSTRSLALMYSAAVTTVVLSVVLGKTYPQFVPLPAIALLLAIFFGQRSAIAVAFPMAIFIAVDHLIDFNNFVALVTATGAAIASYSKRRNSLVSTGLVIGMAQAFGFLAALSVGQSQITLTAVVLAKQTGLEFLGGIASSVAAIGLLPFIENIYGLVTPFRLAELTDADQPLLRRLEEHAPGTYQHSLGVANLAEAGARAVGGDVNLVRAGAYYHDIGKMARPKYFIENQLGATNPHDSMTPEQSVERVLAHVTDGLEFAKQNSLPKAVQDFIPMHQGTSLMAYFYHKACMRDGVDNVDQNFYRYPGPKPQSKETSIVMLADVSEAVTHSMKDPTEEEIEAAMAKVFQNRWDDGQFSESGLTYAEVQRVKKAFVRVWRTLHHDRLKYPSTTTGRMPVPPSNLPTAASLANVVTGNEFPTVVPRTKADTVAGAKIAAERAALEAPAATPSEQTAAPNENGKDPSAETNDPGPDSEPGCC